jgi:hypothetical protein
MATATGLHRYRPGEKYSKSMLFLDPSVSVGGNIYSHIWGFAPNKATLDMTDATARAKFHRLLTLIRTPARRGPYLRQQREVYVFGLTDRVGAGMYDDLGLRTRRAKTIASLLSRLLAGMNKPPKIHAVPWRPPKPYSKYFNKGGTEFLRAQGRAVLVALKTPRLPPTCVPFQGADGIKRALTVLANILSGSSASRLSGKQLKFLKAVLAMLQKNGNDEYVTGAYVKQCVETFFKAHRTEYNRLMKMGHGQLIAEGTRYSMKSIPVRGSERMVWTAELANRILKKKNPGIFVARTLSLRKRWRGIVRDTCQDATKVIPLLRHSVNEIETGYDALFKMTFRRAMAQMVGSYLGISNFDKILDNLIDSAFRNHFRQLLTRSDTVYSVYRRVYHP